MDYGLGNLFSVLHACRAVGIDAQIASDPAIVAQAPGAILPGVGAFADAMSQLEAQGLADALRERAAQDRPLVGICLGLQLLFGSSDEFGTTPGLGILPGHVRRLSGDAKVPQVGWNRIRPPEGAADRWTGTPLAGVDPGRHMYFVHSYVVEPEEPEDVLALTDYGGGTFCSAALRGAVLGLQFHPERSGPGGLDLYRALRAFLLPKVHP